MPDHHSAPKLHDLTAETKERKRSEAMAVSKSTAASADTPSQVDTPMSDANEEQPTSVPVDSVDVVCNFFFLALSCTFV